MLLTFLIKRRNVLAGKDVLFPLLYECIYRRHGSMILLCTNLDQRVMLNFYCAVGSFRHLRCAGLGLCQKRLPYFLRRCQIFQQARCSFSSHIIVRAGVASPSSAGIEIRVDSKCVDNCGIRPPADYALRRFFSSDTALPPPRNSESICHVLSARE